MAKWFGKKAGNMMGFGGRGGCLEKEISALWRFIFILKFLKNLRIVQNDVLSGTFKNNNFSYVNGKKFRGMSLFFVE